jgi:hypothetical protein
MNRLEKALAVMVVGAVFAGCAMKKPTSKDYECKEVHTEGRVLIDADCDGDVDLIRRKGSKYTTPRAEFVAADMADELKGAYGVDNGFRTPRMTPEIQDTATRAYHAMNALHFAVDSERYRRHKNR